MPILLGYLDYGSKKIGLDTYIQPSGDVIADCDKIANFYDNIQAKYPEKFTNLKLSDSQIASFQQNIDEA